MSDKYIKRTKKGKGRKRKDFLKDIEQLRQRIKPEIQIALSLMVIESLKEKDTGKKNSPYKEVKNYN